MDGDLVEFSVDIVVAPFGAVDSMPFEFVFEMLGVLSVAEVDIVFCFL